MSMNRRDFLTGSAKGAVGVMVAAAGLSALPGTAHAAMQRRPDGKGLKILILGGTGFLGPAVIDAAKARGHTVTLFNRGRTEKRKPGQFVDDEKIYGNRNPDKYAGTKVVDGKEVDDPDSPKGLAELEKAIAGGRKWDAIVDTSGYFPRHVKASAELLAKAAKHYVFISTVSVYAGNDKKGADETSTIATIPDTTVEEFGAQMQNYGPCKALCEAEVEKAFPGHTTSIRAGYIVGPNDTSDRFTYWPLRALRGGEILVAGGESDPVQLIDVRDLAEWSVHCIEHGVAGAYDALGPAKTLTVKETIDACIASAKAHGGPAATATFVPYEFLQNNGLPAGTLPIFLPTEGETAGFHFRNNAKAVKAGLKFRPVRETVDAILDWWPKELERRVAMTKKMTEDAKAKGQTDFKMADPTQLRAGIPPEAEAKALEEWKKSKKG